MARLMFALAVPLIAACTASGPKPQSLPSPDSAATADSQTMSREAMEDRQRERMGASPYGGM